MAACPERHAQGRSGGLGGHDCGVAARDSAPRPCWRSPRGAPPPPPLPRPCGLGMEGGCHENGSRGPPGEPAEAFLVAEPLNGRGVARDGGRRGFERGPGGGRGLEGSTDGGPPPPPPPRAWLLPPRPACWGPGLNQHFPCRGLEASLWRSQAFSDGAVFASGRGR